MGCFTLFMVYCMQKTLKGPQKTVILVFSAIFALNLFAWAGKQTLILQLREPLRAGPSELIVPAVTNFKGEVRDLRISVQFGDTLGESKEIQESASSSPGVDMTVTSVGRRSFLIKLSLQQPAMVEIVLMDIYGKNLGVLFAGQCTLREMSWKHVFKEKDPGGLRILAMKVDGKIAVKRVLPQVKE